MPQAMMKAFVLSIRLVVTVDLDQSDGLNLRSSLSQDERGDGARRWRNGRRSAFLGAVARVAALRRKDHAPLPIRIFIAARALVVAIGVVAAAVCGAAEEPTTGAAHDVARSPAEAKPAAESRKPLPADATSAQVVNLSGRSLHFKATAGAIRLSDDKGAPEADIAYIAYQMEGADSVRRPVTFVFNGGPGAGSAWLQLGAVGPWRLPMDGLAPSSAPLLVDNEETWLDFTDLVFVDPPGAGYSRVLAPGEEARRRLWSVSGDIDALSAAVRRWLAANDRLLSPKFILGESYGGFRGPRLAEALATKQGAGVSGLVLISPALDIGAVSTRVGDPFGFVSRLPSYAAAFRERSGKVSREDLADVEQYASRDYLLDFLRGPKDAAAVARMVQHVSALTGLDPALVGQLGGRVSKEAFLREFDRRQGKIVAFYDATVSAPDPQPTEYQDRWLDPVLEGFDAPFSSAIMDVYNRRLGWKIDDRYEMSNDSVSRAWRWGDGLESPESVGALKRMLALDANFRVLITHGLTDLQTPYFATQLLLDQIPDYGPPGRLTLKVYPGGHMHYSRDETRKALREDARRLIERR
jgi:carboxypeptidase C (cathepsin A)